MPRIRTVHTDALRRNCLYCLAAEGPFGSEEHVIPRSLGPDTERFVIPPGGVCDPCNNWLGGQVDTPFVDRFDMRLTRALEGLRGRRGALPDLIEGREVVAKLDLDLDGAKVTMYASKVEETADGGLDIEIRPKVRDPPDVVARTIRALWKIALGCIYLTNRGEALDPRWDHLRRGVLGYPFAGYLLQRPFTAGITRRLDVNVNVADPESPIAMTFVLGGVALAVPIGLGATVARADVVRAGWEVRASDSVAPTTLRFRLEPDPHADEGSP